MTDTAPGKAQSLKKRFQGIQGLSEDLSLFSRLRAALLAAILGGVFTWAAFGSLWGFDSDLFWPIAGAGIAAALAAFMLQPVRAVVYGVFGALYILLLLVGAVIGAVVGAIG